MDVDELETVDVGDDDDSKLARGAECFDLTKTLAVLLKAEFGLLRDTAANREVLKRKAIEIMAQRGVRPSHAAMHLPLAVTRALVPTQSDIEDARLRRSVEYRTLIGLVDHGTA